MMGDLAHRAAPAAPEATPAQAVLGRVCVILRDTVIDGGEFADPRFSRSTLLASYGLGAKDVDTILCEIEIEFGIDTGDVDERSISRVSDLCDVVESRLIGGAA